MDADREAHVTDSWLQRALTLLGRGDGSGAVEAMREVLGRDPDNAHAHAILALALVVARRLHAAEHEGSPRPPAGARCRHRPSRAGRGVPCAPQAGRRRGAPGGRTGRGIRTIRRCCEGWPQSTIWPAAAIALPLLEQALALDPDDADTLVAIGNHHLEAGDLARAEEMACAVLAEVAEHQDALVLMGHILLRRGEVDDAWSHTRAAAAINPTDAGALHLLCAIQARRNPFLGLWWRWNSWMTVLGAAEQMILLLATFVTYRVATLVFADTGQPGLARAVRFVWLGIVVYTWVSPLIFRRMLRRALASVRMRADF